MAVATPNRLRMTNFSAPTLSELYGENGKHGEFSLYIFVGITCGGGPLLRRKGRFFFSGVFRQLMQRKLRLDQGACILTVNRAQEAHHLLQTGNLKINMLQLVLYGLGGVE